MGMHPRRLLLLVSLYSTLVAGPASAYLYALDGATFRSSWSQQFRLDQVGWFDYMRVDLLPDAGDAEFDPSVFRNFSIGGWSDQVSTAFQGTATGPEAQDISFGLFFTGTPADGIGFRFAAYEAIGGTHYWRDSAEVRYTDGPQGGWQIRQLMQHEHDPSGTIQPVPEASTLTLFGPGLALLFYGMARRRGYSA